MAGGKPDWYKELGVPHEGQEYTESDKTVYWTFANKGESKAQAEAGAKKDQTSKSKFIKSKFIKVPEAHREEKGDRGLILQWERL